MPICKRFSTGANRSTGWIAAFVCLAAVGCFKVSEKPVAREEAVSLDPFAAALAAAEPGDRPYIAAAKPVLDAIAARDQAALYATLSSHARAFCRPEQFVTPLEENQIQQPLIKELAKSLNIPEEQVRAGKLHQYDEDDDPGEKPYFNVKFVLVEEAGELKVGYFEFMPPSMFD